MSLVVPFLGFYVMWRIIKLLRAGQAETGFGKICLASALAVPSCMVSSGVLVVLFITIYETI
ncbi:MAG: hypothetical protein V3W41_12265 [Planctomycetota bacterium]